MTAFTGKRLREFSAYGPCIERGTIIRHTEKTVTYLSDPNGPNLPGCVLRAGGHAWTNGELSQTDLTPTHVVGTGTLHVEPCPGCRDHAQTQYPHGYMD